MKTLYNNDIAADSILLLSLIQLKQQTQNNYIMKMNSLETDSYTVISRSYYSRDLLYNSELSTEHKTLFSFDEIAIKENIKKVYALHYYCINLHFNEEN